MQEIIDDAEMDDVVDSAVRVSKRKAYVGFTIHTTNTSFQGR